MVNAIKIQAEKSDQETEHRAAGVAHENTGRRKVIGEKAQACTEQTPCDRTSGADSRRRVHRGVAKGNQRRHTARDSVRTVKEIECVYEDGDEEAGENRIENRMAEDCQVPLGLAEEKSRAELRH